MTDRPPQAELQVFLQEIRAIGYAEENAEITHAPDGAHTIRYQKGDWTYEDSFYGGEPYGGREIIHHHGRPVWFAGYYGYLLETELTSSDVYRFLREALREASEEVVYRSPVRYAAGDLEYVNECEGNQNRFQGTERIREGGQGIYVCDYFGGLVDQPAPAKMS